MTKNYQKIHEAHAEFFERYTKFFVRATYTAIIAGTLGIMGAMHLYTSKTPTYQQAIPESRATVQPPPPAIYTERPHQQTREPQPTYQSQEYDTIEDILGN